MRDPNEKGSDSEDQNKKYPEEVSPQETQNQSVSNETKKTCADCGTSKTPLWRGGPAGPKSLCNACGIRSSKKRRAFSGLNKGEDKKSKKGNSNPNNFSSSNTKNLGDNLKQSLSKILMQISKEQRRKFGEEEQAAILLMALSYGSVYA